MSCSSIICKRFEPVPPAAPAPSPETRVRAARRRGRISLLALGSVAGIVMTLVVWALQSWAQGSLETQLREEAVRSLRQSVDLRVEGLRSWAGRQKDLARKVFEDPELVAQAARLVEMESNPVDLKARLLASPAFKKAGEIMAAASPEIADRGYIIISPSGLDLLSESDEIVGRVVTADGAAYVRRVNLGQYILSRPYPDRQFAQGLARDFRNPVMFVGGPIKNAAGTIIAMGFSPLLAGPLLRLPEIVGRRDPGLRRKEPAPQ